MTRRMVVLAAALLVMAGNSGGAQVTRPVRTLAQPLALPVGILVQTPIKPLRRAPWAAAETTKRRETAIVRGGLFGFIAGGAYSGARLGSGDVPPDDRRLLLYPVVGLALGVLLGALWPIGSPH